MSVYSTVMLSYSLWSSDQDVSYSLQVTKKIWPMDLMVYVDIAVIQGVLITIATFIDTVLLSLSLYKVLALTINFTKYLPSFIF